MNVPLRATLLLLAINALAPDTAAVSGNCNFLIGDRELSETYLGIRGLDSQGAFGVNVEIAPADDVPLAIALGGHLAGREKNDVRLGFAEFSAGVLWTPQVGRSFRFYLGGGLSRAVASADLDADSFDLFGDDEQDDDTALGYYFNGGGFWRLGERFNLGFDLRALRHAEFELHDELTSGNYVQVSLLLGFGWGSRGSH